MNKKINFNITDDYHKNILSWYNQYGRNNLPWQKDFNPYKVWISEIMLQQTQVKTVIPYFNNFIQIFPNIEILAKSNVDKVLLHWSGLGYYSRAHNLYRTAKIICDKFSSKIPNSFENLISLPGIGKTTANAILSISFNQATPIMDANVKRLFSRLFTLHIIKYTKEVWDLAYMLMPTHNTQKYTQAQMDLGALICKAKNPKCEICPLQTICLAYLKSKVHEYPLKKERKEKKIVKKTYYIYKHCSKILMFKEQDNKVWRGMYLLPDKQLNFGTFKEIICENQKHTFSHFRLIYKILYFKVTNIKDYDINQYTWIDITKIDFYAIPKAIKKYIKYLYN